MLKRSMSIVFPNVFYKRSVTELNALQQQRW